MNEGGPKDILNDSIPQALKTCKKLIQMLEEQCLGIESTSLERLIRGLMAYYQHCFMLWIVDRKCINVVALHWATQLCFFYSSVCVCVCVCVFVCVYVSVCVHACVCTHTHTHTLARGSVRENTLRNRQTRQESQRQREY